MVGEGAVRHSGGMYPGRRFKSDLEKSFLNIDNIDNSLLFYHFSDYCGHSMIVVVVHLLLILQYMSASIIIVV